MSHAYSYLSLSTVLLSTLAPPPHTRPTLAPPLATSHRRRISWPHRLLPVMPVPYELEPPHRASASSLPHHTSSPRASSNVPHQQCPTTGPHARSATALTSPPPHGCHVSTSTPARPPPSPVLLRSARRPLSLDHVRPTSVSSMPTASPPLLQGIAPPPATAMD
jgi:hypothetical protein